LKHVRLPNRFVSLACAGAVALGVAFAPANVPANAQSGPPPPPVPNGTPVPPVTTPQAAGNPTPLPSNLPIPSSAPSPAITPTPEPSESPGRHGRRRRPAPEATAEPSPSATPTSPAFATLDGTWETQVQYIDHTDYSYLVIKQNPTGEITGMWRVSGKEYPFDGSYDGRLIRLLVKEPSGNLTWSGYVEGASDMVGTIDFGQGKVDPTPFTAEHRAAPKNPFRKDDSGSRGTRPGGGPAGGSPPVPPH
jgi:hypothetical protein